ncbi:hypothetical protein IE077_000977 [Cardiosporidium cionae]|uniref:Piwi domain-containing protein n=1 Tax=Cardiosporidium cionae TaxID=476202 RepID=A0ABQ7JG90_9APIC|nr:hypothetical protein IE077_000977 [Cardiosporidium cionae]|eukprot:KAF8823055.1 hypothetical protein IE077_000977 [Cardiosporidium cionae]
MAERRHYFSRHGFSSESSSDRKRPYNESFVNVPLHEKSYHTRRDPQFHETGRHSVVEVKRGRRGPPSRGSINKSAQLDSRLLPFLHDSNPSLFANAFGFSLKSDATIFVFSVRLAGRDTALEPNDYKLKQRIMHCAKVREITKGQPDSFYFNDFLIVFDKCVESQLGVTNALLADFQDEVYDITFTQQGSITPSSFLEKGNVSIVSRFLTIVMNKVWQALRLSKIGRTQHLVDYTIDSNYAGKRQKPGWDIVLNPTASAGFLLVADPRNRLVETNSVQDFLGNNEFSFTEKGKLLKDRLCYTTYRSAFYRIDHVTGCNADEPIEYAQTVKFELKRPDAAIRTISIEDYLKETYDVTLRSRNSPLVVLKSISTRDKGNFVKIPAECLHLLCNSLPERGSFREIKGATDKIRETMEFRNLLDQEAATEILDRFKIQVSPQLFELSKYIKPLSNEGCIQWKGGKSGGNSNGYLGRDFATDLLKNYGLYSEVEIGKKWLPVVILDEKSSRDPIQRIYEDFMRIINSLPLAMSAPVVAAADNGAPYFKYSPTHALENPLQFKSSIKQKIRLHMQKHAIMAIIVLLPGEASSGNDKTQPIYQALKQCGFELDIPLQCLKWSTLKKFEGRCWSKLYCALQAKVWDAQHLHGIPWIFSSADTKGALVAGPFPDAKKIRTIAIATFPLHAQKSIGVAMTANSNPEHSRVLLAAGTSPIRHGQVIVNIEECFSKLWERLKMHSFEKNRQGIPVPPSTLLIYRSGISDGQFRLLTLHEIQGIREFLGKQLGLSLQALWDFCVIYLFVCTSHSGNAVEVKKAASLEQHGNSFVYSTVLGEDESLVEGHSIILESEIAMKKYFQIQTIGNEFGILLEEDFRKDTDLNWISLVSEMNFECLFIVMVYTNASGERKRAQSPLKMEHRSGIECFISFGDAKAFSNSKKHQISISRLVICREMAIIYLVAGKNILRFFEVGGGRVRVPDRGLYIEDGITRVTHTGERIDEFHLFCSNPDLGAPSPVNYQILLNESKWTTEFIAKITYRMCHLYYNWSGTVKRPHLLLLAQKFAEQLAMYCESPESLTRFASREDSNMVIQDYNERNKVLENVSSQLMCTCLPL